MNLKLPSKIKGWFNANDHPDNLLTKFATTKQQKYLIALVGYFNQTLFHYLLSQSNKVMAEDVLQTTWLKVINKNHQYNGGTSAKCWLFTIARNALIDELRKQQKWQYQELEDCHIKSVPLTEQVIAELANEQQLTQFNFLIQRLPFHQREAFIFQQEGFSLKEIASLTNENQETIKSRLRYSKQYLRAHLEIKT